MTKLDEIETAIRQLSADEIAKLREFLDDLEGQMLDARIERDAVSGKLDKVLDRVRQNQKAGQREDF